jgi:hypothetical protein
MVTSHSRTAAVVFDSSAVAFVALVGAAVAMGISPVFVRFAEIGPFASAFWRVALALPFLWLWSRLEPRPPDPATTAQTASSPCSWGAALRW